MGSEYAIRKKAGSAAPITETARQGPSLDALRAGAAKPTREQMGHRVDLPDVMRAKMENAFGADLSAVKLYESETVADAGADAFAQGTNIAFAPGMLDFTSFGGQALLGHEISHVVSQQRGEVTGGGFLNDRALDARADREGALAAAGQQITAPTAAMSSVTAAPAAGPMQAKKPEQERGIVPGPVAQKPQAQIPQAEHEADRLSASVSSGSPDAVKAAMGRKMGADFTGVRFHTDDASAEKADSMGARAYTSGADVYFNSSGFDPGVAAHELVHTVQQGVVSGSAQTVSTPVGGIQMEKELTRKQKEALGRKQTANNAKYNARLAKMGPEAVERVLSGKGGFFERHRFKRIMKHLNGEGSILGQESRKGEISDANIAMLYGAGDASRNFITDRVLGNFVNHVAKVHGDNADAGSKPGADPRAYISTLQNQSVRAGGGGALAEYGGLAQAVSQSAAAPLKQDYQLDVPQDVTEMRAHANAMLDAKMIDPTDTSLTDAAEAAYWSHVNEDSTRLYDAIPGKIAGRNSEMMAFNGETMQRLGRAMPDLFNAQNEDTVRSFVGKSFALRGFLPAFSKTLGGTYGGQLASKNLSRLNKDIMKPGAGGGTTAALRDMLVPSMGGGAPAAAPAPAPAPAPMPAPMPAPVQRMPVTPNPKLLQNVAAARAAMPGHRMTVTPNPELLRKYGRR